MIDQKKQIRERLKGPCSHLSEASFDELVDKIAANEGRIPHVSSTSRNPWKMEQ
jgi:hypothetical protein